MLIRTTFLRWIAIPLVAAFLVSACNGDDEHFGGAVVGAACENNGDCQERCVRGGEWPGGMCTVNCHDDFDCPDATACIEDEGGICALTCGSDGECADLGPGWECHSRNREGHSGDVSVCRG